MDVGMATAYMPETGGRIDIGPMPGWSAAWLLSMDARARDATLATADDSGSWPMHYRDQKTDALVSLDDHPNMTILGNPSDAKNDAFPACTDCATPLTVDSAHQPAIVYLPYVLTGDVYYLDELALWANFDMLQSNPGYRDQAKGLVAPDQVRGQAWSMRTLGQLAYILPDQHPFKAYFQTRLDDNIAHYASAFAPNGSAYNALGALVTGSAYSYDNDTGIAPWQDAFFTWAIGNLVEMDFASAKPLLDFKAKFSVGLMTDPGYCWIDASAYTLDIRASSSSAVYDTFAKLYQANFPSTTCNASSGVMTGYPDSPEGYPSNLQPALAVATSSSVPRAAAAWSTFAGRTTKPDYGTEPQFAIVPR
jgi:hypothetical protein